MFPFYILSNKSKPIFVITLLLAAAFFAGAFTEPSLLPPQDNTPGPLDVSTSTQTKAGDLTIGGQLTAGQICLGGTCASSWDDLRSIVGFTRVLSGGTGADSGADIISTADGGYILVGTYDSTSYAFFGIWKTDKLGNSLWSNSAGIIGFSFGRSVKQASNGNFIAGARSIDYGYTISRAYILIYSNSGSLISATIINENNMEGDFVELGEVQPTSDGGYIAVGKFINPTGLPAGNYNVLKLNSSFAIQWGFLFRADAQTGLVVTQTSDGGFVVGGGEGAYGYLMKLNSTGGLAWLVKYNDVVPNLQSIAGVYQASDGGILTGEACYSCLNGTSAGRLRKFNSTLSSQIFAVSPANPTEYLPGGVVTFDKYLEDIIEDPAGNYVAAGAISYNFIAASYWSQKNYEALLFKVSPAGAIIGQKLYGIAGGLYQNSMEALYGLVNGQDSGYASAGTGGFGRGGFINSKMMFLKADSNFKSLLVW